MKKVVVFVSLWIITLSLYAQKQAANWYFGENAGLNFNLDNNSVNVIQGGQLNTREGCASISDDRGNLLFYTDGVTIWGRNHNPMPNGTGLRGDSSSAQSGIIVPKPNDPNIYYVFTVDNFLDQVNYGLNYSIVDMSLNNGFGDVTTKNTNLLQNCSEKITAVVRDCLDGSIWVLTFASPDGTVPVYNTFHAFEVSDTGVNQNSIKSTFSTSISDARGYLKLSPNGKRVACANVSNGMYVYDFDASSGRVTNEKLITLTGKDNAIFPYGVEFSPDSDLLYINASNDFFDPENPMNANNPLNHFAALYQFDLREDDLQMTEIILDERNLYRGALQLGPDGKIYRALSESYLNGLSGLSIIENPNEIGPSCDYRHDVISLSPASSSQGLPPFVASFFNAQIDIIQNGRSQTNLDICENGSYTLRSITIPGATYTWTRDGVTLSDNDYDLEVTQAGHYEVFIDPNNGECAIEGQAFVAFNENPIGFNDTIFQCDEDGSKDGFTLFNLEEAIVDLTGGVEGLSAKFYRDAARTNEITEPDNFVNTSSIQTIYAEVFNIKTECKVDVELTLDISVTDAFDTEIAVCDEDDVDDGLHEFSLTNGNSRITEGLPTGLNVSYYETYEDALLETNSLGDTYTNKNPYSQTIYARVENNNDCYGISEVLLTVDQPPQIESEALVYYCTNFFPETITIDAGLIGSNYADFTYNWSTGENTYEIDINAAGAYNVMVTNINSGCASERTVTVDPSNLATFESFEVVDATQNNKITVYVSGEGVYQFSLINQDNGTVTPFQDSNEFQNVKPGIYTVTVRDVENNCGTVEDAVSVIGFPKFFTPNNDGQNDTWQVYGVSEMFQPNSKILIFNRYGKLMKEITPLGEGWDGLLNGQILPADDYWFSVTLQDGRVFKDHFTLKY